jgi:anti-sigma B factor antagonist
VAENRSTQQDMDSVDWDMTIAVAAAPGGSVAIAGQVDASNAVRLRRAIVDAAATPGTGLELDLDLEGITFMDSTGLRAISDASLALAAIGRGLVLSNVPRQVRRLLDITERFGSLTLTVRE